MINNVDPMQIGRLHGAWCPTSSSLIPSTWAMPCVPLAGMQMGVFVVPPIGAGVWVEFEQGDPDYPIWTGCFWGSAAEVPALALAGDPGEPEHRAADAGAEHADRDQRPARARPAGSCSRAPPARSIIVNDTGIFIQNGKGATIVMTGPTVTINNGALVVI